MAYSRHEILLVASELARKADEAIPTAKLARGPALQLARKLDVGLRDQDRIVFSPKDKRIIRAWLEAEGVNWQSPAPPSGGKRIAHAGFEPDEKASSAPVSRSHGLWAFAAIGGDGVMFEKMAIAPSTGLFHVAGDVPIGAFCADYVLTVENYEPFLVFAQPAGSPVDCEGAGLMVLKTTPFFPEGMNRAQHLCQWHDLPHFHAGDLDFHGLSHIMEFRCNGAVLPKLSDLAERDWRTQKHLIDKHEAISRRIADRAQAIAPELLPWIEWVDTHGGLTQEALINAQVGWQLVRF